MGITKPRGNQLKVASLTTAEIKDHSVGPDDIASGSLSGSVFIDGSIPAEKVDISTFAGEGLEYNPGTHALDVTFVVSDQATLQGNIFNGPDQLVRLDNIGRLPPLDGSLLTGVSALPVNFIDMETPSGSIDGVNSVFILSHTPTAGSLHLYLNGILLRAGVDNDFTLSGSTVTMATAPSLGSHICATYRA